MTSFSEGTGISATSAVEEAQREPLPVENQDRGLQCSHQSSSGSGLAEVLQRTRLLKAGIVAAVLLFATCRTSSSSSMTSRHVKDRHALYRTRTFFFRFLLFSSKRLRPSGLSGPDNASCPLPFLRTYRGEWKCVFGPSGAFMTLPCSCRWGWAALPLARGPVRKIAIP